MGPGPVQVLSLILAVWVVVSRPVPLAWMRSVIVAPLRAALRCFLATVRVSVPVAVRLALPRVLLPSFAEAVTLAPAAVRTLKRSLPVLRSAFSETVLATVTFSSARRGVAVGVG